MQYEHEVKYYECDRMGITHHSNYIRIMEEARVYWMDRIGYGFERMEADGVMSPVIEISCRYKHTSTFKDVIKVDIKVAEMSSLKIGFDYIMTVGGNTVCEAHSTHCFLENGRPVSLEKRFPELYKLITDEISKADKQL